MDRSEWVPVPRVPTAEMMRAAQDNPEYRASADGAYRTYAAMIAAAPPPPAEQASGELLTVVADAIRSTGHVTNSDKWEVAEAVLAALSQRPVADLHELANSWLFDDGYMTGVAEIDGPTLHRAEAKQECAQALLAALAPQQPEKGEAP